MRRLLAIVALCLGLTSSCFGLNAECIIDWEGITQGAFNHATAPTGTHGSYDSWGTGTSTRFTIVADDLGYTFPRPVVVGGVTYTGAGSNVLHNNTAAGTADEYVDFFLPGGYGAPTVSSVVTACFIRFDTSNETGSQINLDLMTYLPSSGGNWSVSQLQMQPNDGTINMVAHASSGANLGSHNLQKNKTYWLVHYRDMANTQVTVSLYDPADSFALVSTASIACGNENLGWLRMTSGYIGDPSGSVTIGDIVFLYEPTAQELIDIHTPLASGSGDGTATATAVTATTLTISP